MRVDLANYTNQYVLCKGWITDWRRIDDTTIRIYIEKPVIKKPNKDLVFDDLDLISIEHHINLFLPCSDYDFKQMPYERYECVTFAGYINQYTRKDGTTDYGVYPVKQSRLHQDLMEMDDYMNEIKERFSTYSTEALIHLEKNVKPHIMHLQEELVDAGDLLPTFFHTYEYYEEEIELWKRLTTKLCKIIRVIHSNRRLRRRYKVAENLAIYIPEYDFNNAVAQMRNPLKRINKKALKKGSRAV